MLGTGHGRRGVELHLSQVVDGLADRGGTRRRQPLTHHAQPAGLAVRELERRRASRQATLRRGHEERPTPIAEHRCDAGCPRCRRPASPRRRSARPLRVSRRVAPLSTRARPRVGRGVDPAGSRLGVGRGCRHLPRPLHRGHRHGTRGVRAGDRGDRGGARDPGHGVLRGPVGRAGRGRDPWWDPARPGRGRAGIAHLALDRRGPGRGRDGRDRVLDPGRSRGSCCWPC